MIIMKKIIFILQIAFLNLTLPSVLNTSPVFAADKPSTILSNKVAIDLAQTHANYLWTLIAGALAFFMHAGLAKAVVYESGS
jgi:ammonium transporter, Amt family